MNKNANELSDAVIKAFVGDPNISQSKMFGTVGLKIKGKVFAFPWKEMLILKLPEDRVKELIESKEGIYFDPGHGRISKVWVAIKPLTKEKWLGLAKEAKEFVSSQ